MQAKSNNQMEVYELMDDAISNAVARRSLGSKTEASLTTLSEDEVGAIRGGQKVPVVITAGIIEVPKEVM